MNLCTASYILAHCHTLSPIAARCLSQSRTALPDSRTHLHTSAHIHAYYPVLLYTAASIPRCMAAHCHVHSRTASTAAPPHRHTATLHRTTQHYTVHVHFMYTLAYYYRTLYVAQMLVHCCPTLPHTTVNAAHCHTQPCTLLHTAVHSHTALAPPLHYFTLPHHWLIMLSTKRFHISPHTFVCICFNCSLRLSAVCSVLCAVVRHCTVERTAVSGSAAVCVDVCRRVSV
jgi:hypothetical protein